MLHWLSRHNVSKGITFLQETHTTDECKRVWGNVFKGDILMSHGTNNSKGVAILLGDKLEHKIQETSIDRRGRYIILSVVIQGR